MVAAKHVKPTKKNTLRAVLRTIGMAFRMARILQLARDIQSALQNTGQVPEGPGVGSPDSGAGSGPDIDFPTDWGFFDGF
jgi:hypothetical protein